jgi:hypothetical protein
MRAFIPILSQSQLDQVNHPTMAFTSGTRETPAWHNLWWCVRHVPGDVSRYLYFMHFSLLLWLILPTLALLDINPGIASMTRGILTPYSPVQWVLTGFNVVLAGWFALLAACIVCSCGARPARPKPIHRKPEGS